ncbi:unnamed protein product [Sympodiomycopsis kandeliae]
MVFMTTLNSGAASNPSDNTSVYGNEVAHHRNQIPRNQSAKQTRGPWQLDTAHAYNKIRHHHDHHHHQVDSDGQPRLSFNSSSSPATPPLSSSPDKSSFSSPPTSFTSSSIGFSPVFNGNMSSFESDQLTTKPSTSNWDMDTTKMSSGPTEHSILDPSSSSRQRTAIQNDHGSSRFSTPHRSPSSSSTLSRSGAIKSRNDIFAPSPILTPPRPPPFAATMSPTSSQAETSCNDSTSMGTLTSPFSPASSSRNSLFFTESPSARPPPTHSSSNNGFEVWRGGWQPNQDTTSTRQHLSVKDEEALAYSAEVSRANSFGRSNEEERARERVRIRQDKEVDFRLAPSKDFILGQGRHCTVFLGAYRRKLKRRRERLSPSSDSVSNVQGEDKSQWKLCAIKRLNADRESQLLGLDEAFALRRLGSHPGIIKLIDIRDEVLAEISPLPTPQPADDPQKQLDDQAALGHGRPSKTVVHGRSTSSSSRMESNTDDADPPSLLDRSPIYPQRSAHSRIASQPTSTQLRRMPPPSVMIARPPEEEEEQGMEEFDQSHEDESDGVPVSAAAMRSETKVDAARHLDTSSNPGSDPPRLLILLELLPFTLSTFTRRNAESIDLNFWISIGVAMSEALDFIHGKGCIHSDIKPENILLDKDCRPKLCDFNSAIFLNSTAGGTSQITDGLGLGTPGYGAPELTKRNHGKNLSFAVDIFSLGAVLYSLATGVEPMHRARSMIDMLHRKDRWFISEENDRIARYSIDGGGGSGSNAGSASASRHGSLRGKHPKQKSITSSVTNVFPSNDSAPSSPPILRRQTSADSLESQASSITNTEGKTPSLDAISLLLQPSEVVGVMLPPVEKRLRVCSLRRRQQSEKQWSGGHHRASSLNKHQNSSTSGVAASLRAAIVEKISKNNDDIPTAVALAAKGGGASAAADTLLLQRPAVLRRTTSYGDQPQTTNPQEEHRGDSSQSHLALSTPTAKVEEEEEESPRTADEEHLKLALAATFANAVRRNTPATLGGSTFSSRHRRGPSASSLSSSFSHPAADQEDDDDGEEEEEEDGGAESTVNEPYRDGSPALILPSGVDRLPQEALDLIESMVHANPLKRPDARRVKEVLLSIQRRHKQM